MDASWSCPFRSSSIKKKSGQKFRVLVLSRQLQDNEAIIPTSPLSVKLKPPQPLVDQTARLQPQRYFSDGYEAYSSLLYPRGQHAVAPGKSETYSVEGDV